jgi:lysophospholipase L1-like esterase
MDGTVKIALLVSTLLNLLFFGLGSIFVTKRGGITYLIRKLAFLQPFQFRVAAMYDTPFYQDKKSHFETLPKSEAEIIFLGDSLTDLCEWSEFFRNNRIKNRGICGDTTDGILNRITNIVESQPQKIFIMISINDLNQGRDVESIFGNYKQILEVFKNQIPATEIYIQSVLPVTKRFNEAEINEKIVQLNAKLKDLAKEFSVQYIDLFSYFLDKNNQLDARYTLDGVHLNGEGYLLWKQVIEKDVVN